MTSSHDLSVFFTDSEVAKGLMLNHNLRSLYMYTFYSDSLLECSSLTGQSVNLLVARKQLM